jgi:2-oxoglutarate ferredoxin oxidoreductase subunit alpha
MSSYPEIHPRFVEEGRTDFKPFRRDPETLAREWAVPGMKGCEHRIGGLEKTHEGVLSNDPANHELMVRERAEKVERVVSDIPDLTVDGPAEGELAVVGWGGTFGHLLSAVSEVRQEGIEVSRIHFDFINPLPSNTEKVLSGFDKILVCELNTGQFAGYLRAKHPDHKYLQCNKIQGQTFLVRDIV